MTSPRNSLPSSRLIEKALVLLLLGGLGYACLVVVSPFAAPFVWAVILASSTWPYYVAVAEGLGGRRALAAVGLTLAILLVFVVPVVFAVNAVTDNLPALQALPGKLAGFYSGEPPAWLANLPWIGPRVDAEWRAGTLHTLLDPEKIRPLLTKAGAWLLQQGANLAVATAHVLLATLMAGLLYAHGDEAAAVIERLALRIGGPYTLNAVHVAARTVRSVALGVIGTALVQAILSGLGFMLAGVPGAAILGLTCFLTSTLQTGTHLVWIPVVIWLGHEGREGWAVFMIAWSMFTNTVDNFIKPYLIGKTTPLPFLLIVVGVVGGLLAWGVVGIFLGTTLLAVAYTVFFEWLDRTEPGGHSPE